MTIRPGRLHRELLQPGQATQRPELPDPDRIRRSELSPHKVGIIAFSDHADRAVLTAEAAHLSAGVPTGVKLPNTYDPGSGQSWTTNPLSYLDTDLADRILTLG